MPLLTVVMPVYNADRYLARAIDSILAQTYRDFVFVIVNDGSTDTSPEILEQYAKHDQRIQIIHQENRGLAGALNRGCAEVRTPLIARMDGDDIARPERFAKQVDYLEKHPDVAVVGTMATLIDAEGNPYHYTPTFPTTPNDVAHQIQRYNVLVHPSIMMRKDAYDETTGYRRAVVPAEDYDLWLRIGEKHQLANLPDVLLDYTVHNQRASTRLIDNQILGCLAGRLAAQRRQQGKADPLDHIEQAGRNDLLAMGATESQIDEALIEGYVEAANLSFTTGQADQAFALLDEVGEKPWSPSAAKRLRSERAWIEAKCAKNAGKLMTATSSLLRAAFHRPATLKRLGKGTKGQRD